MRFPFPLLSQARDERDPIALVLESLCLAYVDVARVDNLDPLIPYVELLELGLSPGVGIRDYPKPNKALTDWIMSGRPSPDALESMTVTRAADDTESNARQSRQAEIVRALGGTCREWKEAYDRYRECWGRDSLHLSRAPLWTGLWPLISEELENLRNAVANYGTDPSALK